MADITAISSKENVSRLKIINLGIRTLTLASRFLFIFFLAKFLTPQEVGLYGLVTASVAYSLYLVGLDFYTFTTREFASKDKKYWGGLLKDQALLSLGLYSIVLPTLSLIFVFGVLPWNVAKWFFILVVLEHICQELTRLFVATSEQVAASIVLFLRQGTWALAVVAIMFADEYSRQLNVVFAAWVISCLLALAFSIFKLRSMGLGAWDSKIDRQWIWKGIKIAVPFLIATLAIRGVFTIDRYWLAHLAGLDIVGAYVLFIGISGTLMAFLDAGVFSFSYPSMINAANRQDEQLFSAKVREMIALTIIFCLVFLVISLLLLPYLLDWLGKEVYLNNYSIFYWLLAATIINAFSMIPHYGVYARKHDRAIIRSHIIALPIFIATSTLLSLLTAVYAVPIGLCITQLFILIWKLQAYIKSRTTIIDSYDDRVTD